MKATIYFIDGFGPPLELKGNSLGVSEVGSYTRIKDYENEDNSMLAQIMTDKILYIRYDDTPQVRVTVREIIKDVQDRRKSSQ